jgi:hypothetical protein
VDEHAGCWYSWFPGVLRGFSGGLLLGALRRSIQIPFHGFPKTLEIYAHQVSTKHLVVGHCNPFQRLVAKFHNRPF